MNVNKPMDELTYEQKTEFRNAAHCSICNKKFQPDDTKSKTTATSQANTEAQRM